MTKTGSIFLSVTESFPLVAGDRQRKVEFYSMGDGTVAISIYESDEEDPMAIALIAEDDLAGVALALPALGIVPRR